MYDKGESSGKYVLINLRLVAPDLTTCFNQNIANGTCSPLRCGKIRGTTRSYSAVRLAVCCSCTVYVIRYTRSLLFVVYTTFSLCHSYDRQLDLLFEKDRRRYFIFRYFLVSFGL